jgi:ABC-2 type transport system permease protein
MFKRIWAIIQKEFIQIVRDRVTLAIICTMPMLQLLLFAYAIHMDVKHIRLVVADQSLDQASRTYLDAMVNSGYFDIVSTVSAPSDVIRTIDGGKALAGIIIPPDFAAHEMKKDARIMFLVDGSDPFSTQSAYNAATIVSQSFSTQLVFNTVNPAGAGATVQSLSGLDTHLRILYNPDLKDLWFIIPGMIAMLLQTQTIALTAAAVVRERETGTIEQILVSPIRPVELMIGKMAPNLLIAMFNMLSILLVGTIGFGVPFQGNILVFIGLALIYVFSGLGLGLLISTVSQNQRQTQQLMMMFSFVGMIVGGFIFPRYSMPLVIRLIGNLFPLTYFIPISRGIFTKGIGAVYLWDYILPLLVYDGVILFVAARLFRQRLD